MERNHNSNSNHNRERLLGVGGSDHGLLRTTTTQPPPPATTTSSDFVLQWGNRKRLRCMKIQVKDHATDPVHRTTVRVDRRVIRSDTNKDNHTSHQGSVITSTANHGNGYLNLRQRPSSPSHRILRNSEISMAMKGHGNGVMRGLSSPDRGGSAQDKRGAHHNTTAAATTTTNNHITSNNNDNNNGGGGGGSGSTETAHDSKKGGGTSSGSEAIPAVWPPKFVIALTNKEKEEDFIAFKGSKLPQRPKKRAKFIQRTLNLVSPGAWLCDLTLERYEVREKKISKKRPRGLKAMGNMESDSE
ncbi:NADH-quinone oxidoreductase subunit N like [Actinidia chinensis var. chinensis]|uniref:NADH-quinone oxidoreductase subunit N like n=1 Tax=Actinidia chinensis var. chinensis TaxID=1590841 RepID=A0A2R6PHE8_ACTCC|nr:NADH-quinone oxidoreductase subunit N like [Actinidia chinensis var. chinensis]